MMQIGSQHLRSWSELYCLWHMRMQSLFQSHGLDQEVACYITTLPVFERCNPFPVCMLATTYTFMLQIELHPLLQAWYRSC